jgi:hypothetical protein
MYRSMLLSDPEDLTILVERKYGDEAAHQQLQLVPQVDKLFVV